MVAVTSALNLTILQAFIYLTDFITHLYPYPSTGQTLQIDTTPFDLSSHSQTIPITSAALLVSKTDHLCWFFLENRAFWEKVGKDFLIVGKLRKRGMSSRRHECKEMQVEWKWMSVW